MIAGKGLIRLGVRQADFDYLASLETPIFDVLGTAGPLYAAIYNGLARYHVKLGDIKVDDPTSNPGDVQVSCYLLDFSVLVRYRLDRVEVRSTRPAALGRDGLSTLVEDTMKILREVSQLPRVAKHVLSLSLHGLLPEGTMATLLAKFVPAGPEGTPPFRPSGVSFACEWAGGEGEGSVVLERSASIHEGAFLRATTVYPGKISERDAFQRAADFFDRVTGALNLELEQGS